MFPEYRLFSIPGRVALALAALSLCVPASGDEQESNYWEKTSETFFEEVDAGARVVVDNPHGNIWVRFGGYEKKVEIIATSQRLEPDMTPLVVRRDASGPDLEISVRVDQKDDLEALEPQRKDRIDLVLFVPIGRRVELSTVDDNIAVKGLKGDLQVRTVTGEVMLRKIEGALDIRSERGNVLALLESGVTKSDQSFETITGDIEVTVYEDASYEVLIATSGVISTDFSIDIEHRRFEEPGKYARTVLGGGGPKLTMTSKRGSVSLLRQQKYFDNEKRDPS